MTVIAVILAVAVIATVYLMLRHLRESERAHVLERRELLTRIQRPELVPLPDVAYPQPESEPDEIGLIGTIHELIEE